VIMMTFPVSGVLLMSSSSMPSEMVSATPNTQSFGRSQWNSQPSVLLQEHDSSVGDMDNAIAG